MNGNSGTLRSWDRVEPHTHRPPHTCGLTFTHFSVEGAQIHQMQKRFISKGMATSYVIGVERQGDGLHLTSLLSEI